MKLASEYPSIYSYNRVTDANVGTTGPSSGFSGDNE